MSIGHATGRKFVRVSLGAAVRDEAGNSAVIAATYIGRASPPGQNHPDDEESRPL